MEILKVEKLNKSFISHGQTKKALNDVSFQLNKQEILGIVGESGSGKSTILKIIANLISKDSGRIELFGNEIKYLDKKIYRDLQMIFQDSKSSFNPRNSIGKSIKNTLKYLDLDKNMKISDLLKMVGLSPEYENKLPRELSGGQCQRAAIARAFSVNPRLLLCDEITSALDVCAQDKIVKLLIHLSKVHDTGVIFVSHDLPLVSSFCDKILVMKNGRVVEYGDTAKVIKQSKDPYTNDLLNHILDI